MRDSSANRWFTIATLGALSMSMVILYPPPAKDYQRTTLTPVSESCTGGGIAATRKHLVVLAAEDTPEWRVKGARRLAALDLARCASRTKLPVRTKVGNMRNDASERAGV